MKPSFPRLRCDDCGAIMDRTPDKPFGFWVCLCCWFDALGKKDHPQ